MRTLFYRVQRVGCERRWGQEDPSRRNTASAPVFAGGFAVHKYSVRCAEVWWICLYTFRIGRPGRIRPGVEPSSRNQGRFLVVGHADHPALHRLLTRDLAIGGTEDFKDFGPPGRRITIQPRSRFRHCWCRQMGSRSAAVYGADTVSAACERSRQAIRHACGRHAHNLHGEESAPTLRDCSSFSGRDRSNLEKIRKCVFAKCQEPSFVRGPRAARQFRQVGRDPIS